jgi:hypothetical protein
MVYFTPAGPREETRAARHGFQTLLLIDWLCENKTAIVSETNRLWKLWMGQRDQADRIDHGAWT